jgi:hypothetical protein
MALKTNSFKTVTKVVTSTPDTVYTAPIGYSSVIILAQIANISSTNSYDVSLIHQRGSVNTELFQNFPVSRNDTINLLTGRLVLETNDKLIIYGSDQTGQDLKLTISLLETLN